MVVRTAVWVLGGVRDGVRVGDPPEGVVVHAGVLLRVLRVLQLRIVLRRVAVRGGIVEVEGRVSIAPVRVGRVALRPRGVLRRGLGIDVFAHIHVIPQRSLEIVPAVPVPVPVSVVPVPVPVPQLPDVPAVPDGLSIPHISHVYHHLLLLLRLLRLLLLLLLWRRDVMTGSKWLLGSAGALIAVLRLLLLLLLRWTASRGKRTFAGGFCLSLLLLLLLQLLLLLDDGRRQRQTQSLLHLIHGRHQLRMSLQY